MERKLGEVFTYNGKIYRVVPNSVFSCEGCAFKGRCFCSADSNIVGKCFKYLRNDKTRIIFKEVKKHMDIKNNQLIIEIPEGMEIDIKNSNLANGVIKFKEKIVTYDSINLNFKEEVTGIVVHKDNGYKLSALDKLMTIAKYYNGNWKPDWTNSFESKYYILYKYNENCYYTTYRHSMINNPVIFKNEEDAQSVIDNPNFKNILDAVYKN